MSGEAKLTKAQIKFLDQLRGMSTSFQPGFDFDVLRGSEMAMARRLSDVGLVEERFKPGRGPYWDITPAGLAALSQNKDADHG